MIVVAGGDSFVYGSELADCGDTEWSYSHSTFTALLAQGHEYQCVAWPGYGNDSIARTVIAQCQQLTEMPFVIVSWTFPGRYEFRFNYNSKQRTGPWYSINPWTVDSAKIDELKTFAKMFYHHVGDSEYWEVYSTLKEIVYLQNYLKLNKIPYLFTCADNSILYNYTVRNADTVINSLYKQIDQEPWFWFEPGTAVDHTHEPRGFYQWAVENKYKIGSTHPLEQAHQDAAILIQEKFDELVKKHIQ
jgi:hypothetical protein